MADIKLFRYSTSGVSELASHSMALEKSLQNIFEKNLEAFLGIAFLASEFATTNGGRMDSLGIDENLCPVIIEYKRATNENVINQGLFYLDWLMDHRAEFKLLVMDRLGKEKADKIEWSAPRLVCIAGDFTKYDEHAVRQMNRNIELIRYRRFDGDLLMLELLTSASAPTKVISTGDGRNSQTTYRGVGDLLKTAPIPLQDIFQATTDYLMGIDDVVQRKELQFYHAFKRIKNFACLEIRPSAGRVLVYVKVTPTAENLVPGFTRDMREVGHFGTGDLEISLRNMADLERAKPLLTESFEAS
jgi:predicted transport protein